MKCSCGASKEIKGDRLPSGWKRLGDQVYCQNCWGARYVLRAVTFPVAGPFNMEWEELRPLLKEAWALSTGLANWTVHTLAKHDIVRTPSIGDRCPKLEPLYLYPLARTAFPAMPPQSLNAVTRAAEKKYKAARLETVWRHAAALPTYRSPTPFPIPSQGWTARWMTDKEHVPILRVRLGDKPVELRLRGGHEFRRQLGAFAKLISGEAIPGEAAIYQVSAHASANRSGMSQRDTAGGARVHTRVMVKLVMWLPKKEAPKRDSKTMILATAKDCFWVGLVEGREPWQVNADHVRRWIIEHAKFRERISDDTKHEKRLPQRMRQQIDDAVAWRCKKQNDRLNSFCHTAARSVVEFARRQNVTAIEFDGRCKEYLPSFPWFKIRELLKQKAAEYDITVVDYKEPEDAKAEK